ITLSLQCTLDGAVCIEMVVRVFSSNVTEETPGQENTKAQPKQEEGESEAMEVGDAGEAGPEAALGGWAGESRKEEEELVEVVKEDPWTGEWATFRLPREVAEQEWRERKAQKAPFWCQMAETERWRQAREYFVRKVCHREQQKALAEIWQNTHGAKKE
ncbi:hypothetical protein JRQ81_003096, partial [Phrynocephalus forsythii]